MNGEYTQPCVYDSGLWVTLMCPHPYIDNMELVVKDDKYIQYEKNGMFKLNDNYKKGKSQS
tara:strand:+ start:13 stop:195 length:183 start_codon:yes stop_codon:yes gene_type:complete